MDLVQAAELDAAALAERVFTELSGGRPTAHSLAVVVVVLVGFGFAVAYALLVAVRQGGSRGRNKRQSVLAAAQRDRLRLFANSPHSWGAQLASGAEGTALECGVCYEVLEPEEAHVRVCSVCRMTVHEKCVEHATSGCKRLALRATRQPPPPGPLPRVPSGPGDLVVAATSPRASSGEPSGSASAQQHWRRIAHHWFEIPENAAEQLLEATTRCLFCREPCDKRFLTPHLYFGCLWCQHVAHAECLTASTGALRGRGNAADGEVPWCPLGQFRRMLVPPVYVRECAPQPQADDAEQPSTSSGARGDSLYARMPVSPLKSAVDRAKAMQASLRKRARNKQGHRRGLSGEDIGRVYSASGELRALDGKRDIRTLAERFEVLPLPAESRPVLIFVNLRSGPQEGAALLAKLRQVLNPLQVCELPGEGGAGPEEALELFRGVRNLRIGVCGGDGTVSWVLSAMDSLRARYGPDSVPAAPIAILPLGTGNDLARTLNWAAGGFGLEGGNFSARVYQWLRECERASTVLMDRWTTAVAPRSASLPYRELSTLNYYSIGVDAKVALSFHTLREEHPSLFKSQVGNKALYLGVGAPEALLHSCSELPRKARVECDGKLLGLPKDLEGILVLNISSYMGGVVMWQPDDEDDRGWGKQQFNDGLLEVVGICGTWHLGKLQVGLSKGARRLAQCRHVRIVTDAELPMQVDGEPWSQPSATITISQRDQVALLRRVDGTSEARIMDTLTEVLDDLAGRGTISADQQRVIFTEVARRLHG